MSSPDRFARRQNRLERGLLDAQVMPRLAHSSIDGGGAIEVRDPNGNTTAVIGTQWDGTTTSASVGGSTPVAPTVPLAVPMPGGLQLYWDGTYVDDSPTRMDFRRITFHAVEDMADLDILSPTQICGEITIATGGTVFAALPPVEHFVVAVTWTESGKFSVESDVAFATPFEIVDPLLWQNHEDALTELNDVTLPALNTALDENEADIAGAIADIGTFGETKDLVEGWRTTGEVTINGGMLEADSVSSPQIAAGSIDVTHLTVADFNNLIYDGDLADPTLANWGASLIRTPPSGTAPAYIEWEAGTSNAHRYNLNVFDAKPGDKFYFSCEVSTPATNTANVTLNAAVQTRNASGAAVGWPKVNPTKSMAPNEPWTTYEGIIEIPAGAAVRAQFDPYTISASGLQKIRMRSMTLRRMSSGKLIVDGAILADHLGANSVIAGKIGADAVTANEVATDTLTSNEIATGAITANELDVEVLRAGFTLTGRVQVGSSFWTPQDGLVIPQPNGGRIQLPADGVTPARFDGHANLMSATIQKDLNIMGATNKVSGQVSLAAGITEPTVPPAMFSSHPSIYSANLDASTASWRVYTGMAPHHSNADWFVSAFQYGGAGGLRITSESTGIMQSDPAQGKAWTTNFHPLGGIGVIGTNYFIYGKDQNRSWGHYIYRISGTTWEKTAEYYVGDALKHVSGTPAITCNTATGVVYLFWSEGNLGKYATWNSSLGLTLVGTTYNDYGQPVGHDAAYVGNGDYGALRTLVAIDVTKQIVCFDSAWNWQGATSTALYPESSPLRGIYYDATSSRFKTLDKSGNLFTLSPYRVDTAFTGSYTWYDGVGTVRETREGPSTSYTLPARGHLNVETPTPPDSGNTDAAQVDKANRVGIYVGVGAAARRHQAYLTVDVNGNSIRRLTMDTVSTGTALTPASNTFVGGTTSTGKIVSAALTGGQPKLEISGDGTIKASKVTDASIVAVKGFPSADQTIPTAAWTTATVLTASEYVGTTSGTVDIVSTGSGAFRVDLPGWYEVKFNFSFNNAPNQTGMRYGAIAVGGTRVASQGNSGPAAGQSGGFIAWEGRLTAAQVLTFQVYQDSGVSLSLTRVSSTENRTFFTIRRVAD